MVSLINNADYYFVLLVNRNRMSKAKFYLFHIQEKKKINCVEINRFLSSLICSLTNMAFYNETLETDFNFIFHLLKR